MDNIEMTLAEGSELQGGKYKIERFIAHGGFGNTYLATNTALKSTLVIKEFFLRGISTREGDTNRVAITVPSNKPIWDKQKKKFFHEAQRISSVRHPGVVRVIDLFEENDTAYYAMDFVEGQSLSQRVKDNGPLDEAVVTDYCRQLLDALAEVHRNGILHLDIKPSNIMADDAGKLTLIDFGASKQILPDDSQMTTTTGLAYTPAYAPPEQQFGKFDKLGPWCDFYSLGATLYHLLTAQTPPDAMELMTGSSQFALPEAVSQKMRDFLKKLINPDINQRPQSVDEAKRLIGDVSQEPQPPIAPIAAPVEATLTQEATAVQKPAESEIVEDDDYEEPSWIKRLLAVLGVALFWFISYPVFFEYYAEPQPLVMVMLLAMAICVGAGVAMHSNQSGAPSKLSQILIDVGYVAITGFYLYAAVKSLIWLNEMSEINVPSLLLDTVLVVMAEYFLIKGLGKPGQSGKLWIGFACIAFAALHLVLMTTMLSMHSFYYWWY